MFNMPICKQMPNIQRDDIYGDYDDKGRLTFIGNTSDCTCVCETHERPKVEYSYCWIYTNMNDEEGGQLEFDLCTQAKVSNGWYPLGGIVKGHMNDAAQAFWRWAE